MLLENYSLKNHNTFHFDIYCQHAYILKKEKELNTLFNQKNIKNLPLLILGGGSNIVFTQDFPGLVLLIQLKGRRLLKEDHEAFWVEAMAGESWHDFVEWTVRQGWPGLENLALIPGTVGAAPIQNIGAYGLELADRLAYVQAFDLKQQKMVVLDKKACKLAYRTSFFKEKGAGSFIITRVVFKLPKLWTALSSYHDVSHWLQENHITTLKPLNIFDAVVAIRQKKLPDPKLIGNVGSFFKNPIVSAQIAEQLRQKYPDLVTYAQHNNTYKIAAAWLIQSCGWKGRSMGLAAVHKQQALVLINQGGATGQEILALAQEIQHSVLEKFNISLEIEPIII